MKAPSWKAELYSILELKMLIFGQSKKSFPEKLACFLTNPIVVPILLTIAGIGIVMELFSPGFGIPGVIGITSLVLFFYGHLVAGITGYEIVSDVHHWGHSRTN